jgi:hypothetical protein
MRSIAPLHAVKRHPEKLALRARPDAPELTALRRILKAEVLPDVGFAKAMVPRFWKPLHKVGRTFDDEAGREVGPNNGDRVTLAGHYLTIA